MRVLVVEDDAETAAYIVRGLHEHGHVADHVADGQDGLLMAVVGLHDVLVVDRMLPGLDGLGRTLRGAGVKAPVLFLTALRGVGDRVQGLEAGGDDYLVRPFAFVELLARLNALAHRPPLSDAPTVLRVADLELDLLRRTAMRARSLSTRRPLTARCARRRACWTPSRPCCALRRSRAPRRALGSPRWT